MGSNLNELRGRREMARIFIKVVESVSDEDSRKAESLRHYHAQYDELQQAITALDPTDKPEDIVVGVKSATLSGSVPK
jgi:hypothetical protein